MLQYIYILYIHCLNNEMKSDTQDGPSGLPTAHLGSELRAVWDEVRVCRVVERGLVDDWDGAEALLDYTLRKALKVEPAEHPVLLTEPALNPKQNREKITEVNQGF